MKRERLPLPHFPNEAALVEWALDQLDPWFVADREVPGTHCSNRRLRLDAVLRPRDPSGWRDDAPAFGVEFKIAAQRSFDTMNFTRWAAQALDYTHTDWDGYGRLWVFTCPSFLAPFTGDHWGFGPDLAARLLGRFGVGELCLLDQEGWGLMVHGTHALWTQRLGVHQAKEWSLAPRVGGDSTAPSRRRPTEKLTQWGGDGPPPPAGSRMSEETRIALRNYDWMVRNRGLDDVELHWDSDTLVYGSGGVEIGTLLEPGFTPGT
ncbi:hypothetical protein BBK14_34190 [Parafrankia soli]|uniref:Uncharacterized protein n=1 Tax=Parafrankia soli TaxID=2599596 RepID=A0A1S1Q7A2_9ACTN|nr:hypothetical protein [Parafrankia soli]OHV29065.1 hypothetical protein BBK14_34190 [Parafrankia soli]